MKRGKRSKQPNKLLREAVPVSADRPVSGWVLLIALVLWTLPAIFVSPAAKENFRLPKLLLSDVLGLLSLILLSWRLWVVDRVDLRGLARRPAVLVALPLLIVAALGLMLSDHPHHVRQALSSFGIAMACLVGWSLLLSEAEKRRILNLLIVPASFLAWVGIAQFYGWIELFQFQGRVQDRITMTSLAGGAFDLAAYLVLPLLIAQTALYRARPAHRPGWLLLILPMLYALLLAQTITAILALVAGTFVLWALFLPWRKVVAVTALLAVAGTGLVLGVGPLRERVFKKAGGLAEGDLNQFLTGRLDGWRAAWWIFEQHPVVGVGHGAYRTEFGSARLALTAEGVEFYSRQHQTYFSNAHSEPLEALAEWGLLGVLALAWAGWCLWRRLRILGQEAGEDGKDRQAWRALAWAGIVAIAVQSSANFPLRVALVAYPCVFFLSWILSSGLPAAVPERRSVGGRVLGGILAVILTGAILVYGGQARGRLEASYRLADVERQTLALGQQGLLSLRPMPGQVRRMLESHLDVLRVAAERDPIEVGIPIARGSVFYLLERPQAAVRAYEEALELEARAEIYANIGRAHFQAGDREAATAAFRKALRLNRLIARRYRSLLTELGLVGPR